MKTIHNVTIFQCEYCNKRLLSKNGAKIHEEQYCSNADSPNQKRIIENQRTCEHQNCETVYSYIPGEAVQEPNHDICLDCGMRF